MVIKGNINEVCKQLHALKKAFVENNVSLSEKTLDKNVEI